MTALLALPPREEIPKALVPNCLELDEGGRIDIRHVIVMNQYPHPPLMEDEIYALSE